MSDIIYAHVYRTTQTAVFVKRKQPRASLKLPKVQQLQPESQGHGGSMT